VDSAAWDAARTAAWDAAWDAAGVVAGLGAGSPAGAFQTSSNIMDAPFNEAQGDWKEKQDLLTRATQMEDVNNRAGQTAKLGEVQRKLTAQGQTDTRAKNERTAAVNEAKLKVQQFLADKPHIDLVKGDKYWMAHDTTTKQLVSTGIPTGAMTEEEAIKLKQQGAIDVVNAQQTGANTRNAASNASAEKRNEAAIAGRIDLKETAPGFDPNAANSQIARGEQAELARLIRDNADLFDPKTKRLVGETVTGEMTGFNQRVRDMRDKLKAIDEKYQYQAPKTSGSTAKPKTNVTKSGVTWR
jgi:hypothetical protein